MKKMHASKVYILMSAIMAFANATMFTTYALYYVAELGLTPFQLVLVGTFLEITVLLMEIPTGVLADTYSRRLSVIIGTFILGIAFFLEGSVPFISETVFHGALSLFVGVVIAEVIRGIGETFLSGAGQAWLADEIGTDQIGDVFLKANQVNQVSSILGVLASVGLASIALNIPFLIGGVLYLGLGVLLVFVMGETNFKRSGEEERSSIRESVKIFRKGYLLVRGTPILMAFLIISLFLGAGSEGFDRLWEAHLITNFEFPNLGEVTLPVWFGIISILANVLCFFTAMIARKYLKLDSEMYVAKYMAIFTFVKILCIIGFSLAGNFTLALISFLLLCMAGVITGPLYDTWINQNLDSSVRATVLSMSSQMNAFGQIVGGPVVGAAASQFTLRIGLSFAAILQLPILIIYLKGMKKKK
ncbi:MFS transporter [Cytobacillus suaedae]|nr:MFS transporter [Cytobacillus suaedae]